MGRSGMLSGPGPITLALLSLSLLKLSFGMLNLGLAGSMETAGMKSSSFSSFVSLDVEEE